MDIAILDAPKTQIAYREDGAEIIVWGADGVSAETLAASVPAGIAWREVSAAEALDLTAPAEGAARLSEIDERLAELDLASVRPLRALLAGVATDEDKAQLAAIEAEAATLRAERQGMGS